MKYIIVSFLFTIAFELKAQDKFDASCSIQDFTDRIIKEVRVIYIEYSFPKVDSITVTEIGYYDLKNVEDKIQGENYVNLKFPNLNNQLNYYIRLSPCKDKIYTSTAPTCTNVKFEGEPKEIKDDYVSQMKELYDILKLKVDGYSYYKSGDKESISIFYRDNQNHLKAIEITPADKNYKSLLAVIARNTK